MRRSDAQAATDGVELSVVVTLVDGGDALARCLDALRAQVDAPPLEVIVPFDASVDVHVQRERHAEVRFLDLGRVATRRSVASEGGRHELYDARRAAGLAAARGGLLALLEDRGAPRPEWARALVTAHRRAGARRIPVAAIGGAIECSSSGLLARAQYLCDFGRYGLPRAEGACATLSDTNVSYARSALESVRATWEGGFHEPRVHAALSQHGALWFDPALVVDSARASGAWTAALAERFHWARLFAAERARHWPRWKRALVVLGSPALPPWLAAKLLDARLERARWDAHLAVALPLTLPLLCAWALGEAAGTLRPQS